MNNKRGFTLIRTRKRNLVSAFTLIEVLVGLSVSAAIFVVATTLVVNIFSSSLRGRQVEMLSQVKNDLTAEFGNSVRWADSVSFVNGILQINSTSYKLLDGRLYRDSLPLTPQEVEITKFEVAKYESRGSTEGPGSGLTAQYFNNLDFTQPAFTQTDFVVNFDWGEGSPDPLIDPNTFSARFTGQIQTVAGEHTFYVASDEAARLWIDGNIVIDDWVVPGFSEVSGRVSLAEGKHDLRLDYFDNFGPARVSFSWQFPGRAKQIVPMTNLYPKSGPVSVEIIAEMQVRSNPSQLDSLSLTLSPRSGNIGTIK